VYSSWDIGPHFRGLSVLKPLTLDRIKARGELY
jgi:hypothetical protein